MLTQWETEAQRGRDTCLTSHKKLVAELRFRPVFLWPFCHRACPLLTPINCSVNWTLPPYRTLQWWLKKCTPGISFFSIAPLDSDDLGKSYPFLIWQRKLWHFSDTSHHKRECKGEKISSGFFFSFLFLVWFWSGKERRAQNPPERNSST